MVMTDRASVPSGRSRRSALAREIASATAAISRTTAATVSTSNTAKGIRFERGVTTRWISGYIDVEYLRSIATASIGMIAAAHADKTMSACRIRLTQRL